GKRIGENTEWNQPTAIDLTQQLKSGDHLLAVRAENQGGAAGLLLKLEVAFPTTKRMTLVSDSSWRVADQGARGWNEPDGSPPGFAAATRLGKLGVQPGGNILAAGAVRGPRKSGEAAPPDSLKAAD